MKFGREKNRMFRQTKQTNGNQFWFEVNLMYVDARIAVFRPALNINRHYI